MNREHLARIWASATRDLQTAVIRLTPSLLAAGQSAGIAQVQEFLSVNELGLALELLCHLIEENGLGLDAETYGCLARAGGVMEIDSALWEPFAPGDASPP